LVVGEWPGYPARVETIEYPAYSFARLLEEEEKDQMMEAFEPL